MKQVKAVKHGIAKTMLQVMRHVYILWPDFACKALELMLDAGFKKERRIASVQLSECGFDAEKAVPQLVKHTARIVSDNLFCGIQQYIADDAIYCNGLRYIEEALEHGNGALILTGHFGNWEFVAQYLTARGFKMAAIARKNDNFESVISTMRNSSKIQVLYNDSTVWTKGVSVLKENILLGIVADQYPKGSAVWSDFLGRATLTAKGTALFCLKAKAPVIPCFMIACRDSYRFEVLPPLYADSLSGSSAEKIQKITDWCNECMGKYIKKYPWQWMWFHKRWR